MQFAPTSVVAAIVASLAVALPAEAQTPPGIPNTGGIPGEVARFQVTVRGTQQEHIDFTWNPSPGPGCSTYAEGSLDEFWEYARGKGLVMEFRNVAGRFVALQRAGRQLGDAAFAAPGNVTRLASGFFQSPSGTGCPTFALRTPDCGKAFAVRSALRFGWSKGMLTLKESDPQKRNPAENCGLLTGGQEFNFTQLSAPYPIILKQRAKLSKRKIFNSKRNLKLVLKDTFLGPLDGPQGYTSFDEKLSGSTTVTLKRLRRR